jgi:hypothetical protein
MTGFRKFPALVGHYLKKQTNQRTPGLNLTLPDK